ncbi:hypothetical protein [Aquabacterium sp.]|uniref:hypothetical protein n=1 Tax=Aquabacterium sp. TaxID=1872578 RepID=UPI002E3726DB|nr:hypothetical protein [Aquabacterium sp.]HEX5312923.1 hypothetical protein [Aquabacterium sp.]
MKQIWAVTGMIAGALALSAVLVAGHDKMSGASQTTAVGLPWQIESLPSGQVRALGVTLGPGGSTLADAQKLWGPNLEIAIIAAPGEAGALEAFVDPAQAGFISGKLVLTLAAPVATVQGMRERALKSEFMESTTRKYTLTPADRQAASAFPVSAMAFIPQANLDAAMVIERFGQPEQRRQVGQGAEAAEHLLYPSKGLDLTLNAKGKDVLQYVAPGDFDRLSAPLKAASQP